MLASEEREGRQFTSMAGTGDKRVTAVANQQRISLSEGRRLDELVGAVRGGAHLAPGRDGRGEPTREGGGERAGRAGRGEGGGQGAGCAQSRAP